MQITARIPAAPPDAPEKPHITWGPRDIAGIASVRPFSADEYERLVAMGVLAEDDRCELIEGNIIEMSPLGSRHIALVNRLVMRLAPLIGPLAIVSVQNAIRLNDYSEPEPDLALLKPKADFYEASLSGPGDILLLIEVADTTLAFDRNVKASLYARHGISELWIVNLEDNTVELFSDPSDTGYVTSRTVRRGETFAPQAFPHVTLEWSDVFGAAQN